MRPERVTFPARAAPGVRLAGLLLDGGGRPCVVSHPHPLAGGDMHNPIVEALWRAAAAAGLRALKYDFRGVGGSTGALTERSPLPLGDLAGAIDFLGQGPVLAMGYSYGARVTLHAMHAGEQIGRAALVALPTRLPANQAAISNLILGRPIRGEQWEETPDLELVGNCPCPALVLAGDHDPLVQLDELRARGVEPSVIEGVNHFFCRRLGNQPPSGRDLGALTDRALRFLLRDAARSG